MVAQHNPGYLVRSLVRVPGSGYNRMAGSESLDLSRASSLAASVRVPQTLPAALVTPKIIKQVHASVNEKLGSGFGVAAGILPSNPSGSGDRKRKHSRDTSEGSYSTPELSLLPKRARLVYMTPQQIISMASRLVNIPTPAGSPLYLPLQNQEPSAPPLSFDEASTVQLIRESNNLRQVNQELQTSLSALSQKNQELQKRISLFQLLFRDKKRLGAVVKRLGVEIP